MNTSPKPRPNLLISQSILGWILLLLVAVISALSLIVPLNNSSSSTQLSLGDVASEDILAPRALSYQSDVLTELLQGEAADAVPAQYTPIDPSVARNQLAQLRDVLDFISNIRADTYSNQAQKEADLAMIQAIHLQSESSKQILELSENDWQTIRSESLNVLGQVMRNTIREDRLEEARRTIPTLVSFTLQGNQPALVIEITSAFVSPNSLYSSELTEAQRDAARQSVQPVIQGFVAGETIVPRGHVITNSDLEALLQFGLLEPKLTWEDNVSVLALVTVNFAFVALYFSQRPDLRSNTTSLILMAILFLVFLYGARILIPNRTVVPYMYPLAGFGMVVTALISSRAAVILSLPLSIFAAYGLPNSYELTLFYIFSCVFGILMLRNIHRLLTFFWAGFGVAISGIVVLIAFQLPDPLLDSVGLFQLIAASGFNGLASASLTLLLQFLLAHLIGLTTTLQLLEISRPDHPLLQDILRNAPGTYQHSLQIANLAEQAAERIGADTLLTRVGSLYHDAGKVGYPHFFIENQVPGFHNPHEDLSPVDSSAIIIQHVTDGVEMVKKNRLPRRIQDFVLEHHGTMVTRYQYTNALNQAGGDTEAVDINLFTYPGPKPQSRETALVMLADGVEARARAERPKTEADVRKLIKDVVDHRLQNGQLNDTKLTLQNLEEVIDSFTTTLRGVYHPRIEYPQLDAITIPRSSQMAEKTQEPSSAEDRR
jgi:putative nucleotidyltransferase with HDIG domain